MGLFEKIATETLKLGIFGIFLVGILFGYSSAAFPASIIFIYLANYFNPFVIAFLGALGTLTEETFVFTFFKKALPKEIKNLEKFVNVFKFKRRIFKLIITLISAIIFITPVPNEVGIYLLSLEHFNPKLFMLLSFCTSFIAILLLALLGHLL